MKWMECRATRREIDEGGEQLSAQALRHVAACAPCLAFQNERARLRELLTSLEPVTAPADFDFRLRARIAAQAEGVGPRSFFSGFTLSTPAMAVAAVVVVVALSVVWLVRVNQNRTPMVASNPQGQGRQADSPKIDNAAPPVTSASDVATATGSNPVPDAPNYLGQGRKPQLRDPGSSQTGRSSSDWSAGSAPSIKQGQNPGAVYVSAPVKPMVLSVQDDNGATRRISLPPVSFGSQRLLVGSRVVPVSGTNDRVW